ncbi:MAG: divalent-cation tolerance protein CutA [Lentisphaerae bacterium]|nr:divalent-cation tolerance protein CutA [Lentisphaerota bacterium]
MKQVLVYVTAPDRATARRIACRVVDARLAACANLLPAIESVYWWNGRVEHGAETAMMLKTRASLVPRLTAEILRLHPYECPCVVALPILGGNPAFLRWIDAEAPAAPAAGRRPRRNRKSASVSR